MSPTLDKELPDVLLARFLILLLLSTISFSRTDRDLPIDDPLLIVTADFNKDGNSDLAFSGKTTPQVFVMSGAGDGTFGAGSV